jgi:hypothetical protein
MRVFDVRTLATRLTPSSRVVVFIVHIVTILSMITIVHAFHCFIAHSTIVITSKARAATSATSRALVVSS